MLGSGCKKFIELDAPKTSITKANVYSNNEIATSVLTGVYIKMSSAGITSLTSVKTLPFLTGLSGDELSLFGTNSTYVAYYSNSLAANNIGAKTYWSEIYNTIYTCNEAVEGIEASATLSPAVKQQLLGEAKFMRAFNYFYLVNLYGDVPLVLSTDYTVNTLKPRSPKSEVYQQIIKDLQEAELALSSGFVDNTLVNSTNERVRPNKWAAKALLARVLLYNQKYAEAEAKATEVINNSSLFSILPLNDIFLKNSKEAIWQLQPVNTGWNTEEARTFVIPSTGLSDIIPVYLSNQLLSSFETGDQRRASWVNSFTNTTVTPNVTYYYPYKYKVSARNAPVTEYSTVLRLAEQYLIRAEARAMQNNLSGSADDLFVIRQRAGLAKINFASQQEAVDAILHERQVELFTEWGHRWLDLKRLNKVDAIMSVVTPLKGGIWNSTDQLYPIQFYELNANPNLTQNPGY
ncbi:RagB/SusD family nutrient uptake outer membrane protein [Mucilaginibacter segetis]|uniref:RagB/SusD family nutrient uptake outer membrane protein n=1 Tax=Mucilaginibacter segetis TaxID=2793071 RepID=A0A934UMX1_9SPHI|nr:RagB/SusD family nutrient uptake outer membrane protein [Mucilaginibacter segetis]MBK0379311.1 RagB/SusD family nutrient uptake outer membrane protein [Mucilaginibacter segetis]